MSCTRTWDANCLDKSQGQEQDDSSHAQSVVISGDGWFYDFGDSNRAFKRDCTVYTGY